MLSSGQLVCLFPDPVLDRDIRLSGFSPPSPEVVWETLISPLSQKFAQGSDELLLHPVLICAMTFKTEVSVLGGGE
jgi:hypothetical protein